jgi:hypothetical protein
MPSSFAQKNAVVTSETADACEKLWSEGLKAQKDKQYTKGHQCFEKALALARMSGKQDMLLAQALCLLGLSYQTEGDGDEAYQNAETGRKGFPYYKEGEELAEKLLGENNPGCRHYIQSLALFYRETEDYKQSEKVYRRVLGIAEKNLGPEDRMLEPILLQMQLLYEHDLNDYAQSNAINDRLLSLFEKHYGKNSQEYAIALTSKAKYMEQSGDKTGARAVQKQAIDLMQACDHKYRSPAFTEEGSGW